MTRAKPKPTPATCVQRLAIYLTAEAEAGHTCPTNEMIARVLGIAELTDVSRMLRRLVKDGRIVLVGAGGNRRQITITATGKVLRARGMHIVLLPKAHKAPAPRGGYKIRDLSNDEIAARVERDQAALHSERMAWLAKELPGLNGVAKSRGLAA